MHHSHFPFLCHSNLLLNLLGIAFDKQRRPLQKGAIFLPVSLVDYLQISSTIPFNSLRLLGYALVLVLQGPARMLLRHVAAELMPVLEVQPAFWAHVVVQALQLRC